MYKAPDYDSKEKLENGPEMWMSEIGFIENLLAEQAKNNDFVNILEWGSGQGTIYFAKFLKEKGVNFKWYAVENFVPWFNKVKSMLMESGLLDKITCVLKNATYESQKEVQEQVDLNEYINYPLELGVKFNFILVDARKRKECIELASTVLAPGGVVVLHDAEREEYHSFDNYIDAGKIAVENISPNSRGGIQKLWVGRVD